MAAQLSLSLTSTVSRRSDVSFTTLLGNQHLKEALASVARAPGLPVLLCGPQGSGKKTAAMDLAAALLCRSQNAPCGVCPACARFKAGSHPDLHILPYEGKPVKIDQVRELRARTFLQPQEAEFKIFIICEADKLSIQCQNALLKSLEESRSCFFILTCQNREAVLQTVRSRCASYHMQQLDQAQLLEALKGLEGDIRQAAARSGGYLGAALGLLGNDAMPWQQAADDYVASLAKGELAVLSACLEVGKLGRDDYIKFLQCARQLLADRLNASGDGRYLSVYEYINRQDELMAHNPGVTALCSALAAESALILGNIGI